MCVLLYLRIASDMCVCMCVVYLAIFKNRYWEKMQKHLRKSIMGTTNFRKGI